IMIILATRNCRFSRRLSESMSGSIILSIEVVAKVQLGRPLLEKNPTMTRCSSVFGGAADLSGTPQQTESSGM
ncbi:MAG: hypothetical protein ACREMZ_17215, partial [Gemmatimonadales bacterium]